ncbi:MAG TPA: GEVED domain-containing protein [Flavipsychrobacter sp.]|nr:GEVED domain-containing protein [Flavipsychrobacter sp.]
MREKLRNHYLKYAWGMLLLLAIAPRINAQSIIIGTGTTTTDGTGADPVCDYYNGLHYQTVYTAAELSTAGLTAGSSLTSIGFSVSQSPGTLANYKVDLAHTAQANAAFYIAPSSTSFTTVVSPFSYTPVVQTAGNFDMIPFTTNFTWDGTSNIVVDICTGPANPYASPYGGVRVTAGTSGASYTRADGAPANTVCTQATGIAATNYDASVLGPKPNVKFNYIAGAACTAKPSAGTASAGATVAGGAVCPGAAFTLASTGSTSASGLIYDWQYNDGGGWISTGGSNLTYNVATGILVATSFRLVVTCTAVNLSDTSNVVALTINPFYNCYCTPVSGCTNEGIQNVTFNTLNNSSNKCTNASGYENFGSLGSLTSVNQGQQVPISVTAWINSNPAGAGVWIDYDHNGVFDTTEFTLVGTTTSFTGTAGAYTFSSSVTIDINALTGITRMRVRSANSTSATQIAKNTACLTTNAYGEYEDYLITINPAITCTGKPSHVTAASASLAVCPTIPFTLTSSGASTGLGLTYEWQYNDGSGYQTLLDATFAPVTSFNYTVPGITVPTSFRFISHCAAGGYDTSNVLSFTINNFMACYCVPSGTLNTSYGINSFATTGGWTNITNLNSGSTSAPYVDYSSTMVLTTSVGSTINISGSGKGTGNTYGWAVFVDWDQSGTFNGPGEIVYSTTNYSNTIPSTASFTVPGNALPGNTKMRVIGDYYNSNPGNPGAPEFCAHTATNPGNAEWEDYMVNIVPPPSCLPTTALGTANVMATSADLNWTENNSASLWEVKYGPAPLTPGTTTTVYTSLNPYTIVSGLTPVTNYQFGIRAICSVGDTSLRSLGSFTTPPTCPVPTGLTSSNLTANSADLDWTENGTAVQWQIEYGPTPLTQGTGTRIVTTSKPHSISSGLLQNTQYAFYIRSVCSPGDTSAWSTSQTFTTLVSCPAPTGISFSNITGSTADVSWTTSGGPEMLEYGPTGHIPGTGTTAGAGGTLIANVTSPYSLSGLLPASGYDVFIRQDCSASSNGVSSNLSRNLATTGAPANDTICGATNLVVNNSTISYVNTNNATTTSTDPSGITGCTTPNNNVWYKFTTGAAGVYNINIYSSRVSPYGTYYGNMAAWMWLYSSSGTCPGVTLTQVADLTACTTPSPVNYPVAPGSSRVMATPSLAASSTYYFVVDGADGSYGNIGFTVSSPLSIKLGKIVAGNIGDANKVEWNTLQEEKTDRFELERSINGKDFFSIYKRNALGEAHRYTYVDNAPIKGTSYYRLKMAAANGSITYSEVVSAMVKASGFDVQAFPNPVADQLTVKVNGVQGANASVTITDIAGKLIKTVQMNSDAEVIYTGGFANGIYLIKYSDNENSKTIRVTKQ